jgi:hypothetical protein
MTRRTPEPTSHGRVSPTATADQSGSTNVWRMLEADKSFADGMKKAGDERAKGEFKPFTGKRPAR